MREEKDMADPSSEVNPHVFLDVRIGEEFGTDGLFTHPFVASHA